ncbi:MULTISPECIES: hypothetical protein [Vibrio]|jgi:hypothetical protein|uniref:Thymidylate kinase n=2 Tax=Vibrio TaxID=662 RepID=A0A2J8GEK8_VIBDI|nr:MULTISPECIES: hypothetical protein [Vibrio]MCF7364521.1 hypothetical protein [Vibrio sp. A1-b2]MCZ4374253.1 hypothetical protein [Vibrio diazotrophicus]MDW6018191.1 hypothetical protein [Vibrio plantisponsor]NNM42661.1 hypothetical protein [Vibrio plantisponsor]PNH77620.1 hypothetical protein C1N27_20365 [Vibrio diazotrophicus]
MTIAELRNLYREKMLVEAIIEPSAHEGSWIVEFRHQAGGFVLLTNASGEECHYADLDLASKSAMAVGFKQVRVESTRD